MRIGFDAKRAAQNRTGLGNYSRFVINGLIRFASGNEYVLYVPSPKKCGLLKELDDRNLPKIFPKSRFWKLFRSFWRVFGIPFRLSSDGIEIYHGLSNELPLTMVRARGARSVVTIHDLIFLRYPRYYNSI